MIASFRGWNDGGHGASMAGTFLAKRVERGQFADIDPERFFDFRATRPHISLVDGHGPPDRLARERVPPRPARALAQDVAAAARERAESALARASARGHRPRGRPRRRARSHARLAARRRHAHAPCAGDGKRERPEHGRAPRRPAVALRGADRHRRRPHDACRAARSRRSRCGPPCRTTSR